jgi:replicative DNA helicase
LNNLHCPEIEQSILGCFLTDKNTLINIDSIKENDFTSIANKAIFEGIKQLYTDDKLVDLPSVYEAINKKVNLSYITSICTFAQVYSIQQHIEILKDKSKRRYIYETFRNTLERLENDEDIDSILGNLDVVTKKIDEGTTQADDPQSILMELLDDLENTEKAPMMYGLEKLDFLTGGIHKGELITLAAKSGVGKTALALQIIRNAAKANKKILFVSREMDKKQIYKRLLTAYTGIESIKLKTKKFEERDWKKVTDGLGTLGQLGIYVNDKLSTVNQIRSRVRQLKPDLVVVDYLQLLQPNASQNNREREVAQMSRDLKNMTLDFEIPIIQLSQLNDENKDSRPTERSLRESKAIYHDSNCVIFIHEPTGKDLEEVLTKMKLSKDGYERLKESGAKIVEIILDKQRDGSRGKFVQLYVGNRLHFQTPQAMKGV